jgi:hypothetical protein
MEKNKVQNKQKFCNVNKVVVCTLLTWMIKSYDVLEEASAARYQMLPKKSKLRYQKELKKKSERQ